MGKEKKNARMDEKEFGGILMQSRQNYLRQLKEFVQSGGASCEKNKGTFEILDVIKAEIEFLLDNKLEVVYEMILHPKSHKQYKKTWNMLVNEYRENKLVESLIIFRLHLDLFDQFVLEWRGTKEYNLSLQEIASTWERETRMPDGYFINSLARIYRIYTSGMQTSRPIGFISLLEEKKEEVIEKVAKIDEEIKK